MLCSLCGFIISSLWVQAYIFQDGFFCIIAPVKVKWPWIIWVNIPLTNQSWAQQTANRMHISWNKTGMIWREWHSSPGGTKIFLIHEKASAMPKWAVSMLSSVADSDIMFTGIPSVKAHHVLLLHLRVIPLIVYGGSCSRPWLCNWPNEPWLIFLGAF